MKKIKWLVAFLIVANLLLGVIGCKDPEIHIHTYSEAWTSDANGHWHEATCEHTTEVSGKAEHTFGEYVSNNDATTEADGTKTRECSVCGYEDTVTDEGSKIHVHTFAEEWTSDANGHWHEATCEHTTEVSGKAAHTFGEYVSNNDATTEADGTKTRECSVCGHEDTVTDEGSKIHVHTFSDSWSKDATYHWHAATCGHTTEVSGKAAHSFGNWTTTKEATEEAEGSKERTCTVCGYPATEVIAKLEHTHKFAEEWSKDATYHWHAATCEHPTEVSGKAEHTFGEYVSNNDATTEKDGTKTRECSVCGYKDTVTDEGSKIIVPAGFRFVKGATITGTESWTPSSVVFVSGRKLTIPDLIVSDHEVTRGEYKAVMGSDPSKASAYDKEGNVLEGDAVLNNPVNYVSWYDALVYCNKLSRQENLTPCYTINSSTDPDTWGSVPTSNNATWNAVTCDFEANGYRLPTEAEWEWLARGGENYTYAGSGTIDDVAWYTGNTNDTGTREVKTKAPNGYGLYDMSGNVWEWCLDWWYGSISDSTASDGATSGNYRVTRGGSWYNGFGFCQVTVRISSIGPDNRNDGIGLRVVRSSSK